MFFNSFTYIAFLLVVLVVFIMTNNKRYVPIRNIFLLLASYYFYSQLNPLYVFLLLFTTIINFYTGHEISKAQLNGLSGKSYIIMAIIASISILVFFKYAYIVDDSVLLPVGLSFFTFQALTYSIDIYRRKISAESSFVNVALFISFFPTLLSGPIERARNLIPQLKTVTELDLATFESGIRLFIFGLFKKVVLADRLASYVNEIYYMPDSQTGSTLALAALFYSFQIYCDFSGYADMAVASGRMLGFRIMNNFNLPYCASTIKDFWRSWHISLTSWFTEYVYISLGGNRVSQLRWLFNISAVFLLSGIWHGATLSFILWGALHAVYYLIEHYWGPKRPNKLYHLLIFVLITFAWVFFRIEDSKVALQVIITICTDFFSPLSLGSSVFSLLITSVLLVLFISREVMVHKNLLNTKLSRIETVLLLLMICLFGISSSQFVYFQF